MAGSEPTHRADYMLAKMYAQGLVELDLFYTVKVFRLKYLDQVRQEQEADPIRIYSLAELEFIIGRYPRNLKNVLELYERFGIVSVERDPRREHRKLAYNFRSPPLPEELIICYEILEVLEGATTYLYSRELIRRSKVLKGAPGVTTTKVGRYATAMASAELIEMEATSHSNRRYRRVSAADPMARRRYLEGLLTG